ncbi:MAG: hypothetical protein AB8G99_23830 [Planctomycetaceae bacterium]
MEQDGIPMRNRIVMTLGTLAMVMSGANALAQDGCDSPVGGFFRFDNQTPWLHGFDRPVSPFSGHASFRPSNYKQAMARASYMQMYGSQFQATYSRRPSPADTYRMSRKLSRRESMTEPAEPIVQNGVMSPIRSIRIAKPQTLPVKTQQPPQIIRAIQREETGPLFPLP